MTNTRDYISPEYLNLLEREWHEAGDIDTYIVACANAMDRAMDEGKARRIEAMLRGEGAPSHTPAPTLPARLVALMRRAECEACEGEAAEVDFDPLAPLTADAGER